MAENPSLSSQKTLTPAFNRMAMVCGRVASIAWSRGVRLSNEVASKLASRSIRDVVIEIPPCLAAMCRGVSPCQCDENDVKLRTH